MKEAKHRDMQVVKNFSDKGKSGKNTTGRPQFQEMMKRIENGNEDNVDYVYVYSLSRFGRNTADVLYNVQMMQDFGVNLLIVKDGIDSAGPSGKIMIPVLSAVAELERENIREQTMAGRRQKANTLVPWGSDWRIESWILYDGWTMMRQGCTRSLLRRFTG